MLLCQQLGRRHQHRLISVSVREPDGRRRHRSLAGAYVSLKQPVHRPAARHRRRYLPDRTQLRAGQPEWQPRREFADISGAHLGSCNEPAALPLHRHPERHHEYLVENETFAREPQLLGALRHMDAAVGKFQPAYSRRPPHPRRYRVVELLPQQLQRRPHVRRYHLGRKPRRGGIDRHKLRKLPVSVRLYHKRAVHLPTQNCPVHQPVKYISAAGFERLNGVFHIEEGYEQIAFAVRHRHLEQRQPRAYALLA